jgi:hypothetical protein
MKKNYILASSAAQWATVVTNSAEQSVVKGLKPAPVLTGRKLNKEKRFRTNNLQLASFFYQQVVYLKGEKTSDMIVLDPRWLCGSICGQFLSPQFSSQARYTIYIINLLCEQFHSKFCRL